MIKFIYIDLFCGAGGTTTGIHQATVNGQPVAQVIACVNHDPLAIESHAANHPETLHFAEDIRTLDLKPVVKHAAKMKAKHPNAKLVLWASLECTNFSLAKGGQPRNADSRTLAEHLIRYIVDLNPDIIQIENVMEFMSWGPLDNKGKPISKKEGADYQRWIRTIKNLGYEHDYRELNSADFGAYTSRKRYFGQFTKPDTAIVWPRPTHVRHTQKTGLFDEPLKKWKPVREVLDMTDKGRSIFNRSKPLSENTLARIYAGLEKFVKGNQDKRKGYMIGYYGGNQPRVYNLDQAAPTIPCRAVHYLVQPEFITKAFGGSANGKAISVDAPAGAVTTVDHHQVVYLVKYFSSGKNVCDIQEPCSTITTKDRLAMVWIDNPAYGGHQVDIDRPAPVVVARQDKAPLMVVNCAAGNPMASYEAESGTMTKIIAFCHEHHISDIRMRMLNVQELKQIQGFPTDYILKGNQSEQKKFLGNAVTPPIAKAWVEAMALNIH